MNDPQEELSPYWLQTARLWGGNMAPPPFAPRTAAAIRAMVNSHPTLSKLIQFNALGGLAVLGGAAEHIDEPER